MFSGTKMMALAAFVLLLAACGSAAAELGDAVLSAGDGSQAEEAAAEQDDALRSSGDGSQRAAGASRLAAGLDEGGVGIQMQLILGTLRLETTELAVDADQAAELIPLWKALRSLSNSDTAAEAEIEAVINQIQESMTPEQIEAIAALELSSEDMGTIIQELGLEFGPPEGTEGFGGDGFRFQDGFVPGGEGQFGGGGQFGGRGQFGGGGDHSGGGEGERFGSDSGQSGGFQGDSGDHEPGVEDGFGRFGRRAGGFLMEPLIELLVERAGLDSST